MLLNVKYKIYKKFKLMTQDNKVKMPTFIGARGRSGGDC